MRTIESIVRDSKFQISYTLDDGTMSAFRCLPEMADFIMFEWEKKLACLRQNPANDAPVTP